MRILILGGAGFLGTHTVKRCLAIPGAEVTVLDSLEFPSGKLPENLKSVWDRIQYVRASITNQKVLNELIPHQNFIFHCAAQSSHTESIRNPLQDAEVNVEGMLKILETMRHKNRDCVLVYPSTTSVIGKALHPEIDEEHPVNPLDVYSIHKAACERYLETYHRVHGLKTVGLRFGNLYGPYGKTTPEFGFINYFIAQALENGNLKIFGEGSQIRNVMYAEDAAALMLQASFSPVLFGKTWMATSRFHLSILEIAKTITDVFQAGKMVHVPWPEDRIPIEIGSVRFSSARLRESTSWTEDTDFRTGLQKTLHVCRFLSKNIPV